MRCSFAPYPRFLATVTPLQPPRIPDVKEMMLHPANGSNQPAFAGPHQLIFISPAPGWLLLRQRLFHCVLPITLGPGLAGLSSGFTDVRFAMADIGSPVRTCRPSGPMIGLVPLWWWRKWKMRGVWNPATPSVLYGFKPRSQQFDHFGGIAKCKCTGRNFPKIARRMTPRISPRSWKFTEPLAAIHPPRLTLSRIERGIQPRGTPAKSGRRMRRIGIPHFGRGKESLRCLPSGAGQ